MYGIFVNENGGIHYASAMAAGYKTIETRSRDMLKNLVGKRVEIIRTHRGKNPVIVGSVDIVAKSFCKAEEFENYFNKHGVPPGSLYAPHGKGKWFYHLENAKACEPYPLPTDAIRHGRSWCEF